VIHSPLYRNYRHLVDEYYSYEDYVKIKRLFSQKLFIFATLQDLYQPAMVPLFDAGLSNDEFTFPLAVVLDLKCPAATLKHIVYFNHNNILERVLDLLDHASEQEYDYSEAMVTAGKYNKVKAMELLLACGKGDPCIGNDEILRLACANGHNEIVKMLLKDGRSNPNSKGGEPLIWGSKYGHAEVVKTLLDCEQVILNLDALRKAIIWGKISVVKVFLGEKRINLCQYQLFDEFISLAAEGKNDEIEMLLMQKKSELFNFFKNYECDSKKNFSLLDEPEEGTRSAVAIKNSKWEYLLGFRPYFIVIISIAIYCHFNYFRVKCVLCTGI
jgi:hypothetical protein